MKSIEELTKMGFKRWQKNGMDRMYINASTLGLNCTYHKTGSIHTATFSGENISNSEGYRLKAAKTYIDLVKHVIVSDSVRLAAAVADLIGVEYSYGQTQIQIPADETVPAQEAPKKQVKAYRVNESEHFNLFSMYDHLKCIEIDMEEKTIPWDESVFDKIEEVEKLMEKAPFVGSEVDWPTLKRIREIKDERQMIRYTTCLAAGAAEKDAAMAFDV